MLEGPGIRQPVFFHVCEEGGVGGGDEAGYVVVAGRGVAVGWVGTVAEVGPEAVEGPGVGGAGCWVCVPELLGVC